jgi:hypothetical protein
MDDPTTIADTTIAYIRDGNLGKAITAMTSYGLAPVNGDTVAQVKDLLIPRKPNPVWTDTRAEYGPVRLGNVGARCQSFYQCSFSQ